MTWVPPNWWSQVTGSADPEVVVAGVRLHDRPLMLAAVVAALLLATAVPVFVSRSSALRDKWLTWLVIAVVVGPVMWWGPLPTAVLAAVLAVVCVGEFTRLLGLTSVDRWVLSVCAVTFPFVALWEPSWLGFLPLLVLFTPLVGILSGDTSRGAERSAYLAFGLVWLCWAPAHLVLVYSDAFLIALLVAITDVASWLGGRSLGKLPGLRRGLGPVSPNKTVAGLLGGAAGAALALVFLGEWQAGLFVAVAVGAPAGDLVESLFKRQAQVKDAGSWLPGFGGLLDRVDSLLLVLPLAAVLAV